jgi:hypothetical protein
VNPRFFFIENIYVMLLVLSLVSVTFPPGSPLSEWRLINFTVCLKPKRNHFTYLLWLFQVLPGLYVGNFRDSKDPSQLDRFKITHIVAIHDAARKLHLVSLNTLLYIVTFMSPLHNNHMLLYNLTFTVCCSLGVYGSCLRSSVNI